MSGILGYTHLLTTTTANTPPSTNQVGHWDASVSGSITIATGVSQWNDLSGMGHHLTQGTGAKQPSYASNIVTFDGINDNLRSVFTLNQPETVYIVLRINGWVAGTYICDGGTTDRMDIYMDNPNPNINIFAGSSLVSSSFGVGTFKVVCAVFNGVTSSYSINDGTKITGNAGTNNAGGFNLGSNGAGTSLFGSIGVREAYLYSAAHSPSEQTSIITYLRAKWGI